MKNKYKFIFIFDNGKDRVQRSYRVTTSLSPTDAIGKADAEAIKLRDKQYPGYEVYVTAGSNTIIKIS